MSPACNLVAGFGSRLMVRVASTAAPCLTSAHSLRESRVRYTPGLAHANPSPGVAFKGVASLGGGDSALSQRRAASPPKLVEEDSPIQRTQHPIPAAIEHMRVDLGGGRLLVAEQFLDGSDVLTGFQQVGGEGMAQRVASGGLDDARAIPRRLDRTLQPGLVHVMAAFHPIAWVHTAHRRGERILPSPVRGGTGVLARQRIG